MQYYFPYWGPFLCKLKVEQEMVNILLEKGNESREKKLDHRSSLAGAIDNSYYYENYEEWFFPIFHKYVDNYISAVKNYVTTSLDAKKPDSWDLDGFWINYQKAYEYNPPHHHSGDLSFVMYLQVPDEIKEENKKMQGVYNNVGPGMIEFDYGTDLPFNISSFFHLPNECDLFIFPAWLKHHVFAFKSDVERISVSGNINFKYKEN